MRRTKDKTGNRGSRFVKIAGVPVPLIVGIAVGASLAFSPYLPCLVSDSPVPFVFYDLQVADKFANGSTNLEYEVRAIPQNADCQYGVAYLVNGLTNQGHWYQVGLSWDWSSYLSSKGYEMNYEVFDTPSHSVYPAGGGGGLKTFSKSINTGDWVVLNLQIANSTVYFTGSDLTTGAVSQTTFPVSGSPFFVGGVNSSVSDSFFTGLMTECYRNRPWNPQLTNDTYLDLKGPMSTQETSIDEWNFSACNYPGGSNQFQPVASGFARYTSAPPISFLWQSIMTWTNSSMFSVQAPS